MIIIAGHVRVVAEKINNRLSVRFGNVVRDAVLMDVLEKLVVRARVNIESRLRNGEVETFRRRRVGIANSKRHSR